MSLTDVIVAYNDDADNDDGDGHAAAAADNNGDEEDGDDEICDSWSFLNILLRNPKRKTKYI